MQHLGVVVTLQGRSREHVSIPLDDAAPALQSSCHHAAFHFLPFVSITIEIQVENRLNRKEELSELQERCL